MSFVHWRNLSIDQTMPAWLFFCRVENLVTTT
jgi:hypothetical protein